MRRLTDKVDVKEQRRLKAIAVRNRGLNLFRINGAFMFIFGFCLIFFAVQATLEHEFPAVRGVPYYSGAFMAGAAVGILSLFSGAVFYIGSKAGGAEIVATKDVKPALTVFILVYIPATILIAVGLMLTIMYGLCSNECSYDDNAGHNYGMAIGLIVMEACSVFTCVVSAFLVLRYSKHFGLDLLCRGGLGQGAKVRPSAELEHPNMYVLEKWRIKMDKMIVFERIMTYLMQTRKPKELDDTDELQSV